MVSASDFALFSCDKIIVFNFREEEQPLPEYIDRVFAAARFLGHEAGEQRYVDRIVMNLHPTIVTHAAFLERARSRRELNIAVSLVEEKLSVFKERPKTQPVDMSSGGRPLQPRAFPECPG